MISFPYAKINLGLNVVERRHDGYHNIESVFLPIALTDVLEIVPARGSHTTLTCYGNHVDCPPENNLVLKAYRLMKEHFGLPPVDIYLYKNIPHGGGLGGGSSDAAHTLLLLRTIFDLDADDKQLTAMATRLGADCAFFIHHRPMLVTGIGDVLTPIDVPLGGKTLLLVKPEASVSTPEAFAHITPSRPIEPLPAIIASPIELWDGRLKNDFEPSVFARLPLLWRIKIALLEAGAQYAAMSGTGSTIFGIFDDANVAELARDNFSDHSTYVIPLK
ncbi:MAG: 4-(cytidine 5'-diphospho)-2-C-methyl-D-erythritol kinase [Muribaculaceae bacterium]|nr:4-(cytidine 5'-diphospho)-2-C-methyl-D-erythritol kinase [Muribaculaceae bacterium]